MMVNELPIEKYVRLVKGNDVVVIVLWRDNYLSVCRFNGPEKSLCYTTSRANKANKRLFYIAESFYTDLGFKRVE